VTKQVYTISDAAAEAGVSIDEIKDAINGGILPAELSQNVGDFIIKQADLIAYIRLVKGKEPSSETNLKRVLIIDDEFNFANLMKLELERGKQIEAKTATYGKDGLLLAKRFKPDIVLIDFMLPDITGDKVLEELRSMQQSKNVKVLVYSAHTEEAVRQVPNLEQRLSELGADEFISKSSGMKPLVAKIYKDLGLEMNVTKK